MSDAVASPASSAATLPQLTPAHITCSRGMAGWLQANQVSLVFTSYQTGRLYLVGADDAGGLAIHEVGTGRAMGVWADPQRLVLATPFQVWRFENILAADQTSQLGSIFRDIVGRLPFSPQDQFGTKTGVVQSWAIALVYGGSSSAAAR